MALAHPVHPLATALVSTWLRCLLDNLIFFVVVAKSLLVPYVWCIVGRGQIQVANAAQNLCHLMDAQERHRQCLSPWHLIHQGVLNQEQL